MPSICRIPVIVIAQSSTMRSAFVLLFLSALAPASAWVGASARALRPATLTMAAGKDGHHLSRRTFASSLATGAAGVVAAAATAEPALAAASTLDGDYLTSDGVKKCLVVNKVHNQTPRQRLLPCHAMPCHATPRHATPRRRTMPLPMPRHFTCPCARPRACPRSNARPHHRTTAAARRRRRLIFTATELSGGVWAGGLLHGDDQDGRGPAAVREDRQRGDP